MKLANRGKHKYSCIYDLSQNTLLIFHIFDVIHLCEKGKHSKYKSPRNAFGLIGKPKSNVE